MMDREVNQWLRLAIVTALVVVVLVLAGCSTVANTPATTTTPTVVETTVKSGTVSLDGLPVSATFRVKSPDPGIKFPVSVEFQRYHLGNWTETHVYNVNESEWFTVELVGMEQYRIVVEDADGDQCTLSGYQANQRNARHTLLINSGHVLSC